MTVDLHAPMHSDVPELRDLIDGADGAVSYFMGANRVRLRRFARPELTTVIRAAKRVVHDDG